MSIQAQVEGKRQKQAVRGATETKDELIEGTQVYTHTPPIRVQMRPLSLSFYLSVLITSSLILISCSSRSFTLGALNSFLWCGEKVRRIAISITFVISSSCVYLLWIMISWQAIRGVSSICSLPFPRREVTGDTGRCITRSWKVWLATPSQISWLN